MRNTVSGPILGSVLGSAEPGPGSRAAIMTPVELDWMETFLAVVDRGGFTAASSQVHRSQSRVSAHIASLERELGTRLIDRSRRPAAVTEAGQVFAAHAREILADVRTARAALAAVRALSGQSIRVQTTACIGATILPAVLAGVLERFPDATVAVSEPDGWSEDAGAAAAEQSVLVVAPVDRDPHPLARRHVLWWEPLQALLPAAHPWARGAGGISVDRLAEQRLVLCPVVGGVIEPLLGEDPGAAPAPRITVEAPHTLAALVAAGLGIGIVNIGLTGLLGDRDLVAVPLRGVDGSADLGLDVAVEWFDVVLTSPIGRALHEAVLLAPTPVGASDRRTRT